ncbi:hypothetical protein Stok01_02467 [Sulfurisphaera tokodaii]
MKEEREYKQKRARAESEILVSIYCKKVRKIKEEGV